MSDKHEQLMVVYDRLTEAIDVLKSVEDGPHKQLPTNIVLAFSATKTAKVLIADTLRGNYLSENQI